MLVHLPNCHWKLRDVGSSRVRLGRVMVLFVLCENQRFDDKGWVGAGLLLRQERVAVLSLTVRVWRREIPLFF